MAQLKDLLVTGASNFIGPVSTEDIQLTKVYAPTSAGGATYSIGSANYVLASDGTAGIYWKDSTADTIDNVSVDWSQQESPSDSLILTVQVNNTSASTDIPQASSTASGIVSIGAQEISGAKTFIDTATFNQIPTSPTPGDSSNDTSVATTEFVKRAFTANEAMLFKGGIDPSSTSENGGALTLAAESGWTYKSTTSGYINGIPVEAGDTFIATTAVATATSENYATIQNDWLVIQANIDGYVIGPPSSTAGGVAIYSGAYGKAITNDDSFVWDITNKILTAEKLNGYIVAGQNDLTQLGEHATAEGTATNASGIASHAEGRNTIASGAYSHAEGNNTIISSVAIAAHAEGLSVSASGMAAHAEGAYTVATANYSHAEGNTTTASGVNSHAEGYNTIAEGLAAHAEGLSTTAYENAAHAEGENTTASGGSSHAEGSETTASGDEAHAEGFQTNAFGNDSHAEGYSTTAFGYSSHAEGTETIAFGDYSHAEGYSTTASGVEAHAEGYYTIASGTASHVEGFQTTASGTASHAEGYQTIASGDSSHAEGTKIKFSGETDYSYPTASALGSHAEGGGTTASGIASHAEGGRTIAGGNASHAEGMKTVASGIASHAEGRATTASGDNSHSQGLYTIAKHADQFVFGAYNVVDTSTALPTGHGNYIEIVGNGTSATARSNARTLDWSGNESLAGNLLPMVNNSQTIGSTTATWKNINIGTTSTANANGLEFIYNGAVKARVGSNTKGGIGIYSTGGTDGGNISLCPSLTQATQGLVVKETAIEFQEENLTFVKSSKSASIVFNTATYALDFVFT